MASTTRRFTLALGAAICIGLWGCSPAGGKLLVGTWELDTAEAAKAAGNPGGEVFQAVVQMIKLKLEFRADGTMAFSMSGMGHEMTESGTWEVVSVEGNTTKLKIRKKGADSKVEVDDVTVTFDGRDKCKVLRPGQDAMVLKRA